MDPLLVQSYLMYDPLQSYLQYSDKRRPLGYVLPCAFSGHCEWLWLLPNQCFGNSTTWQDTSVFYVFYSLGCVA